jgi:Rad3-related DNA helicase
MWNLFHKEKESEGQESEKELCPRVFSNGKSQADVVREVVESIRSGNKNIFIHGVCGSGKSAIALNIARELGKASIVVPIKNLQRQYEEDYMNKKFLLKNNKQKLKIAMITGRNNHKCLYLAENKKEILATRIKEKNSSIYDIFSKPEQKENISKNESSDNLIIPCKIEIKEKNISTLKKYYSENPERKNNKDLDLKTMRRFAVAPACPYWSPIMNSEKKIKFDCPKVTYKSISGEYTIYLRKSGCSYYEQFLSYANSDVIIFNSEQYVLETALGRKPLTEVEIIDECDEFLDSLSVEGTINLNKLSNELFMLDTSDIREKQIIDGCLNLIREILVDSRKYIDKEEILEVCKTKVGELIKIITHNDIFYESRDEESYIEHCFEVAKDFYPILENVYVSFTQDKKKDTYVKLVTVNLEQMLKSITDKNKAFVFMSGTLHSERVLREIFGITDFKTINAETFNQGTITKQKTGLEKDFSYDNFNKGRATREEYLRALDECVRVAKKPCVIHVSAFQDLPSYDEKQQFNLSNLIVASDLIEQQKEDKEGKLVKDFKSGKYSVLFTTRCNRGIDFPYETCNSVVITKFPYPNIQGLFWRILKKNKPAFFWDFYKDKAHRELLQKVYRSVRANDDHVFLLSPDIRVLESKIF